MLNLIKEDLVTFADIISSVVGLDVEIVDSNLFRIAGTGKLHSNISKSIKDQGQVCKTAINEKRRVIMKNPRHNQICMKCKKVNFCTDFFSLYTPILKDDSVIGVIGLVSSSEQSRQKVLSDLDSYCKFIDQIAETMSQKLREVISVKETTELLSIMQQIVNSETQSILILNSKDGITFANQNAIKELQLDKNHPGTKCSITSTQISYSNTDEYILNIAGKEKNVIGDIIQIQSENTKYSKAILFESFEKYIKRISQTYPESYHATGVLSIVGNSPVIKMLRAKTQKISKSTSPVLISGESGTGKEILARAIHAESNRHDEPFIAINCGAIPDALLESELFGYVEGAFTGASRKGNIGKFELAHKGTVFLDEISSMPLHLQVKILRVLQEFQVVRLGSSQVIDVDIRIIAASNDNVEELIEEKKFRADLYYRLNVIPFLIPPLRERVQDIKDLGNFFLHRYCDRFDKRDRVLPSRIINTLKKYPWPGNIRELENTIEYIANVMPDNGPVLQSHLPSYLKTKVVKANSTHSNNIDEILPLSILEQQSIQHAITHFGNSTEGKRKAAEALGISCSTLYRKLSSK